MAIDFKSPWVIGGAGLAFVVILLAVRSGSGASGGVASQSVATGANVQLAGLASQVQINADNANAGIVLGQQTTDRATLGTLFSYLNNGNNNATALAGQRAQIGGSIAINRSNNDAFMTIAPVLAGINANNQQALAKISSGTAITLGQQTTDRAQIGASVAPELAKISGDNAATLATISGNTAATVAGINASTAQTVSNNQASSSAVGTAGSVISSLAPLALALLA